MKFIRAASVALPIAILVPCTLVLTGAGCGDSGGTQPTFALTVQLVVDNNRDGKLDSATDTAARSKNAAIVLPNLDDDASRCPKDGSFDDLLGCFDAADDVINGDEDAKDLSPLRVAPMPNVADGATGMFSATHADKLHIFRKQDGALVALDTMSLSAADLRLGAEFLVEANEVVRDAQAWDGIFEIALEVHNAAGTSLARDTVKFQIAPVLFQHHLNRAETVFVTDIGGKDGNRADTEAGLSDAFETAMNLGSNGAETKFRKLAGKVTDNAVWNQDFWEPGYVSRPTEGGEQTMRVVLLSAEKQAYNAAGRVIDSPDTSKPPAAAVARIDHAPRTKIALQSVRGPDVAVTSVYTTVDLTTAKWPQIQRMFEDDAFNYGGNTEVLPPFENGATKYPFGRMLYGNVKKGAIDPAYDAFFASQLQPPIHIDTSWLYVGHTDEFLSMIPAKNARGWALVVGDPKVTRKILSDLVAAGHGDLLMFKGKTFVSYDDNGAAISTKADVSVADLLADKALAAANDTMIIEVEKQLAIIQKETGLRDDEILRIPAFHHDDSGKSSAHMPDIVNGMLASEAVFLAPDPFGAEFEGKDVIKANMQATFAPHGITIKWVDQWDYLHLALGEVHCGSNVFRSMGSKRWWSAQ
jgi:protein-arginine deiminase